jgi:DNA invertase Pin-like site-specific DNA recombinase
MTAHPKSKKTPLPGRLIGYARVSTEDQGTDPQRDELQAAGCETILEEHASGADRSRPVLAGLLRDIRPGETLVVVRLDRLARSVSHLLAVIEQLEAAGGHFRSLRDPIDTTTPQGMFSLQVLGAVAQLERALIAERTRSGLKAARARGRIGGNPGLRAREPEVIRELRSRRDAVHLDALIANMDSWLPVVRRMRPEATWGNIVRVLNRGGEDNWTDERLRRTVGRVVAEGIVEAACWTAPFPGQGQRPFGRPWMTPAKGPAAAVQIVSLRLRKDRSPRRVFPKAGQRPPPRALS